MKRVIGFIFTLVLAIVIVTGFCSKDVYADETYYISRLRVNDSVADFAYIENDTRTTYWVRLDAGDVISILKEGSPGSTRLTPGDETQLQPSEGGYGYRIACTEYTPDAVEDTGSGDDEREFVDHDIYKSEMPSGTISLKGHIADKAFMDMKVHATDKTAVSNQEFLVKTLIGDYAKAFVTKDIFPRRDLYESEKGQKRVLIWNNLGKVTPGAIKAVVYSQEDGAYVISGYVDDKGTAVFTDLILRQASTVTVVI